MIVTFDARTAREAGRARIEAAENLLHKAEICWIYAELCEKDKRKYSGAHYLNVCEKLERIRMRQETQAETYEAEADSLLSLLDLIPPRDASILRDRHIGGMLWNDVAEKHGYSADTIRGYYSKALEHLGTVILTGQPFTVKRGRQKKTA